MKKIHPRANGAKRRSGCKPGAKVLIPPGYFYTREKSLGSSKFIKFCGRIAIVHGRALIISALVHGVMGGPPNDLNKVDCHGLSEH